MARNWHRLATTDADRRACTIIPQPRQFVNHGHVTVNGQRVNIASYRVKEGDVIECYVMEEVER